MKLCGIYLLTHVESGRRYVGQSRDINRRWKQHESLPSKALLGKAVAKYGWGAFKAEVLELCELDRLNDREAHWVGHLGCVSPLGFNLTNGGKQLCEFTPEVRAKMSRSHLGKTQTPEAIAKTVAAHTGSKRSAESKIRMSAAAKAKTISDEHLEKLLVGLHRPESQAKSAAARIGLKRSLDAIAKTVAANTGRKHTPEALEKMRKPKSEETKAKLSAAAKARAMTPERLEQMRKMSAANVGRKNSPEHIAKTVAYHTGKKRSSEVRAKMSEIQKANYLKRRGIAVATTGDLLS